MTEERRRFPNWRQALITLASGIVLGFSSCDGFLANINSQTTAWAFAIGFFIGVGAFLAGMIMVLVRAIRGA